MDEQELSPAQASRAGLLEMWAAMDAREIARAKAPMRLDMGKARMRMSGGQYGATGNVPRDPATGLPLS